MKINNIFCWTILENNHQCVPFGLFYYKHTFIIAIIFFLSLAVLGFILNTLSFK